MKYEVDKTENYYLLKPKEEKIDSTLSPSLKADLVTFEVEGAKNLIMNLENVKYIDSSGLSALLVGNRIFTEKTVHFCCNFTFTVTWIIRAILFLTILGI